MALSVRSEAIKSVRAVTLLAVAGVLAIPGLANAQTWSPSTMLAVPNLTSFDISWVDYGTNPGSTVPRSYYLADRSNKAIDFWPILGSTGSVTNGTLIQFTANFVGFTGNNDQSGPNGVLTVPGANTQSGLTEIWAGDGPQVNIGCPAFLGGKCSTVKVIQPNGLFAPRVIPTFGAARADELCLDPVDNVVLIANDAEADFSFGTPFVSVIATKTIAGVQTAYTVVTNMQIPLTTNGIEQCQYDRQLGLFFVNIPEVGGHGADTADGQVYVLKFHPGSGGNPGTLTKLGQFIIPNDNCAGPQGMTIGDPQPGTANQQMLLGCNAVSLNGPFAGLRNSVIINKFTGAIIATGPGLGGADEVWSNDNTYYVTGSSCAAGSSACDSGGPQFGMVNFAPNTLQIIPITPVGGVSSHSIAAACNTSGGISGGGPAFLPVAGGVQVYRPSSGGSTSNLTPCLN